MMNHNTECQGLNRIKKNKFTLGFNNKPSYIIKMQNLKTILQSDGMGFVNNWVVQFA